jgi:hypothetical protein
MVAVDRAHDGGARPARVLVLPHAGSVRMRGPFAIGRRSPVPEVPRVQRGPDLALGPRALDRWDAPSARGAAGGVATHHRRATGGARHSAQVVVDRRRRHLQRVGDRGRALSAGRHPVCGCDALRRARRPRQGAHLETGRSQGRAPGSVVCGDPRRTRPARMLGHPLALRGAHATQSLTLAVPSSSHGSPFLTSQQGRTVPARCRDRART